MTPLSPFGSINYLEFNNIFSSSHLSQESDQSSLGSNEGKSPLVNSTENKLTWASFEPWDELGKVVKEFIARNQAHHKEKLAHLFPNIQEAADRPYLGLQIPLPTKSQPI